MSALLYFGVLYIIGGMDEEDIRLLRSILVYRQAGEIDEKGGSPNESGPN
jgi:hypothetical protein